MRCPSCNNIEDKVVDSRLSRGGRTIRRRRECLVCAKRFTTYESVEHEPLSVRKTTGAMETYDRAKILKSIGTACAKRPVSLTMIEELVDRIEESIEAADTREISSQSIGELVMQQLRSLDQVAYVRFASVYRNFQDTTEFMEEVRELVSKAQYRARGQQEMFNPETNAEEG